MFDVAATASVDVDGRRLRRSELLEAAGAVATRIAGAPAVAVHATASLETVVAVLGGLLAGVPVVPVPPDSGPRERAHVLADSGALLVLGGPGDVPYEGVTWDVVDVTARAPQPAPPRSAVPGAAPEAVPALILYTSGTTGAPKGVQVPASAITACLDALAEAWQWTPDDTLVHGLPLFHVHGLVLGVLGALRVGSPLVHTGRPTPAGYARACGAGGSLFFGVPTVWSRVAASGSAPALRRARLLVSGSAPLPASVFAALEAQTGHRVVERYGMTETLITVSARADGERRPGHVGVPLAGVRTRLVGDAAELSGDELPHDGETIGELQVRGATLYTGYLNRPSATAASSTPDGWFRTGDSATIGPDGWHRIVGRTSVDLIKSGGYRVGAGEVEDALRAHPGVAEAAVVGLPDDDLGQRIAAFVVADGVSGPELSEFVAATLSVHKRPREVHVVEALPRNAMGKVLKSALLGA